MSQEAVGLRASVHRTEIGLLERGERLPRIDTVIKLAGALSIPASELLDGIAWNPASTQLGEFSVASPDEAANRQPPHARSLALR